MGNNCDSITKPQLRNLPSNGTGDVCRTYNQNEPNGSNTPMNNLTFQQATGTTGPTGATGNTSNYWQRGLYGFCAGSTDNDVRRSYCNQLGGEWSFRSASNNCTFSDRNTGYYEKSGCCGGSCGISGKGTTCTRDKFSGDPVQCCLNDFNGCGTTSTSSDPYKYDLAYSEDANGDIITPEKLGSIQNSSLPSSGWTCAQNNCQRTCDPCRRSIVSNANTVAFDYRNYDGSNNSTIKTTTCGALESSRGPDFTEGTFNGYCRDVLQTYCSGEDLTDPNDDSWISRWMDNSGNPLRYGCLNVLVRNVYDTSLNKNPSSGCAGVDAYFNSITSGATTCTPSDVADYNVSAAGVEYAQNLLNLVGEKYTENGYIVGSLPGTVGYNPFQDFMYSYICCKFPFLCNSFLSSTCAGYTPDQLANNIAVANWCGCYANDDVYRKYVDEYQVNKECTPYCNRLGVIPLVTPTNQPKYCSGSTCIIDDVAISLSNVDISGSININQMCSNCASGQGASCNCLISNDVITLSNGGYVSLNVNETCTSTLCSVTNPDTGQLENIPCDQTNNENYFKEQQDAQRKAHQQQVRHRNLIILGVIGAVIVVVVLLFYIIRPGLAELDKRLEEVRVKRKVEQRATFDKDVKGVGEMGTTEHSEGIGTFSTSPKIESSFDIPFRG